MERRIKIVWALSLISMLLIIAGQGYWLWNQYQYKNEEYAGEIRQRVMEAVALNDSIRQEQPKKVFGKSNNPFFRSSVNIEMSKQDSVSQPEEHCTRVYIVGSVTDEATDKLQEAVKAGISLPGVGKDSVAYLDTIVIRDESGFLLDMSFSHAMAAYLLQVDVPFTLQRFDSVLATRLDGMTFRTELILPKDTLYQWVETVEKIGSRLYPTVRVVYPYNPMKRQLVQIDVQVMPHTLLLRMGWQLLGSLFMILLLAVCLWFQIKTILKQRRIDELRKSFVNTMIHELKRPVQALKLCVSFLNDKAMRIDEQAMDEVVRDSISELDNLSAYLQKLRDMTRADDEQTQLSLSTFDLKPVVEKLIRLQHAPEGKQVTFETQLADPLLVTADPVHIANIISNLIENAVKYSGSSVHILISCVLHDHQLTLKVADNGIGIPASEQARVFDKFYRSSNLPDRSLPGIGLGLSYVKLLVEAHRGTISLTSQVDKGTTLEIHIPQ